MHLVAIGGSDAGISAALRARELDPGVDVTVVVADAYPNFSICGIPYYISGEVPDWHNLAHRSYADLEATGMQLRLDTTATRIDVDGHQVWLRNARRQRGAAGLRPSGGRHRCRPGAAAHRRPGRAGPRRGRRGAPVAHHGRHLLPTAHARRATPGHRARSSGPVTSGWRWPRA